MQLICKQFNELTNVEIYEILKSRCEVFTLQQNIHYLDMDDVDYDSLHCFYYEDGRVIGYLRAFYKDKQTQEVKVGRVLTLYHHKGIGTRLMMDAISTIPQILPCTKIVMDAQLQAEKFYHKCGFKTVSNIYKEAGIDHVDMELEL